MSLSQDLALVQHRVLPIDPSFRAVDQATIARHLEDARQHAETGATDAFLMALMRLMALPGNGHTRLIPNGAISVHPLRFVSSGTQVRLAGPASGTASGTTSGTAPQAGELLSVNGTPVQQILKAARPFLAGTCQRARVIAPILLVWPFALSHLGVASGHGQTRYHLRDARGTTTELVMDSTTTVPASTLYPSNEHGRADPAWMPERFVTLTDWPDLGLSISLPSFFDPKETALSRAIDEAAKAVRARPGAPLVVDLRGNTGGDFIRTLPLIDAISSSDDRRVAALVDKFTFSAAIVFVTILKHRLTNSNNNPDRSFLRNAALQPDVARAPPLVDVSGQRRDALDHAFDIIGEDMGDGLTFHAEGGLLDLPTSGAQVRYSTAFHDWTHGTTDSTTPPEIARHLVAAGALDIDQTWHLGAPDAALDTHQRILRHMGR